MLRLSFILLLCLLLPSSALAEKRVALVIGIDKYDNLGSNAQLKRARADAAAVARLLKDLAFDVIAKDDVSRSAFNNYWQDFLNKLAPGDTVAFYFAGHGVEFGGRTYLLPRDVPNIKPGRDELLRREAVSLQEFLADLREKGTGLNLVILDACRDNPFEQMAGRSVGARRGLAVTEPPEGTFIMYSAGTGESALDRLNDTDRNANSVYTRHLLPLLKTPGLSLTEVAEQVRVAVRQVAATVQHRQTPAYYNQVLGRVCIAGGECGSPATWSLTVRQSEAGEAWAATKETSNTAVLETFANRYRETFYAELARAKIEELKKQALTAPRSKSAALAAPDRREQEARCDDVRVSVGTMGETLCIRAGSGKSFRDCWGFNNDDACGPEMVVVPAGEFLMGSPATEIGRDSDEGPQRRVAITLPFAVAKYEATFAEWDACVGAGGCQDRLRDEGWGRGKRPVINVSWDQITSQYLPWISRMTGKTYRLMTEAEWEYASRAGTTTRYSFGDAQSELCNYANGADLTAKGNYNWTWAGDCRDGYIHTAPVGSFKPNAFGLHDMHGNASEWVNDCYTRDYGAAPPDGRATLDARGYCARVLRGGAWHEGPQHLRAASRASIAKFDRGNGDDGFRVARTLD